MGPRYSGPRAHAASFGAPRISRARPHSPSSNPIPSPPLTHYPWRRRRRRKMTRRRPSTQHSSTRGMYTHTLSLSLSPSFSSIFVFDILLPLSICTKIAPMSLPKSPFRFLARVPRFHLCPRPPPSLPRSLRFSAVGSR